MRKILFALDDNRFSESAFGFVKKINEQEPVLVTGVYVAPLNMQWITPGADVPLSLRLIRDEAMVQENITAFKDACTAHHINYFVRDNPGSPVPESIRKETRFADLFVIGLDSYYQGEAEGLADEDLRQIIENAECPVLLVPRESNFPENTVIAYDGSEDSVYALKMFAYIFPSMADQHTMIVYAGANATELPDEDHIKELAKRHFSNPGFTVLEFNPKKYFVTWMEEHPGTMLITGAYGRSEWSQILKRSFIQGLLSEHPIPVFIAHK